MFTERDLPVYFPLLSVRDICLKRNTNIINWKSYHKTRENQFECENYTVLVRHAAAYVVRAGGYET